MAKKVNGKSKKPQTSKSVSVVKKPTLARTATKSKPSKVVAAKAGKTTATKSASVKSSVKSSSIKAGSGKIVSPKPSSVKMIKTVVPAPKVEKSAAAAATSAPAKHVVLQTSADAHLEAQFGNGLTLEQLMKVKTGLSRKDIDGYKKILMEKRAEILGDVASLEIDARNKNSGGNLSNMPVHMADIGTDNFQQEFTLGLVESERKLLEEINDALLRIQKGIYGVCLETAKPIGKPRLDAKPYARYCIEVARERERRGPRR